MDRAEMRSAPWRELHAALGAAMETVEGLGSQWRADDDPAIDAAEAAHAEAEEAVAKLEAERATLPAAHQKALAGATMAEIVKVNARIHDIEIELKLAEAIAIDRRIAVEEARGRAAGQIAGPGRPVVNEAEELLLELRDRLNVLRRPITTAEIQATSATSVVGELRRRREQLLAELAPTPVGARR
jgi:hypothetical protein